MEADVIVMGGGLAGLTAALGLAEEGLKVGVVERDAILGGRAASWTDARTGDPVHIGPHIFLDKYPNTLRLFDRLGTTDRIVWQGGGEFLTMVDGRREVPIKTSRLPAPYHYLPSLLEDPTLSLRDLASNWAVVQIALELDEADVMRLDGMNAYAFLRAVGVTSHFIDRFWAFAAQSIMNVPLEVCSAGSLVRFYRYLVADPDLKVGFADGGLGDLFAPGSERLLSELGAVVLKGETVTEILAANDGGRPRVAGVRLANGRRLGAKRVVATLPPHALRPLCPAAWIASDRALADLVHFLPVPYISVYLWFDRKLTRRQFWARAYDPNDLNCDFYDLSNIHRGWHDRPSMIASNIIYSHRANPLDDGAIVAATRAELADYLPEARGAHLVHSVVHRIPMAIHAPFAGMEARRPRPRTSIDGLYLAGDWVRTGLPSSMESAVGSGWMVTEDILAELGRHRTLFTAPPAPGGLADALRVTGKALPFWRIPRWIPAVTPVSDRNCEPPAWDRLLKRGLGRLLGGATKEAATADTHGSARRGARPGRDARA